MKYIILANSKKKQGEKIALVDRSKCKEHFWTEKIELAMVFDSKEAAEIQCKKLNYNNPKVYEFELGKIRLGQVEIYKERKSLIGKMLDQHMQLWHDDDWYEGIND